MMKYRAILLIAVCFGIYSEIGVAQTDPSVAHPQWDGQNQGLSGSRSGGDLWRSPTETGDPDSLSPDDSTNSGSLAGSFNLPNVFNSGEKGFENAKPIEKVEPHIEASSIYDSTAPAVATPRRPTHRIAIIAAISLALLVFRKFRRPNHGIPQKPSFL
jgi:hypothetical protein